MQCCDKEIRFQQRMGAGKLTLFVIEIYLFCNVVKLLSAIVRILYIRITIFKTKMK